MYTLQNGELRSHESSVVNYHESKSSIRGLPYTKTVSVQQINSNDETPLNFAVSLGLYRIVELLLNHGAHHDMTTIFSCCDRNLMFRNFKFPLFTYKQTFDHERDVNHTRSLELILKAGADPNCERIDEPLKYPLFYAIRDADHAKVNLLIEYGANPTLKNTYK